MIFIIRFKVLFNDINKKYPRNLERDSNGYVLDDSCNQFDKNGNYNGYTSVIEDHLG